MEEKFDTPFIFYLTLEDHLPKAFYAFDKSMKELGHMLIPVKIDQLQSLLATTDQSQIIVISSITDSREMKIYSERVRNILKYVLKSKRITFMHCSSFSKLNDSKYYVFQKNYFFMKYPLDSMVLSKKIIRYQEMKSEENIKWPGGRRAGLGAVV